MSYEEDTRATVKLWGTLAIIALAILCGSITTCAVQANYSIERMVKNGSTPMAARCAIKTGDADNVLCITGGK